MPNKAAIIYHPPELAKDSSSNAPFPFWHESDSNHYSTHAHGASQLRSCKPRLCKASSAAVALSAAHLPALTSKRAGCVTFRWQVQLGTAIQLQCLVTAMGGARSLGGNFENQPASNGKHLLTQHGVYFPSKPFRFVPKTHFILSIRSGPGTKWFRLEHAA